MDEYLKAINLYLHNNVDLRYGQAAFNMLLERNPEMAEEVRGTALDPFFWEQHDTTTERFLAWVREKI